MRGRTRDLMGLCKRLEHKGQWALADANCGGPAFPHSALPHQIAASLFGEHLTLYLDIKIHVNQSYCWIKTFPATTRRRIIYKKPTSFPTKFTEEPACACKGFGPAGLIWNEDEHPGSRDVAVGHSLLSHCARLCVHALSLNNYLEQGKLTSVNIQPVLPYIGAAWGLGSCYYPYILPPSDQPRFSPN